MKRILLVSTLLMSCAREAKKEPTLLDRIRDIALRAAVSVICDGRDAGIPDAKEE